MNEIIEVQGTKIAIAQYSGDDYISLTDMTRRFEGGEELIKNWLRLQNTVLFLGTWEKLYNPNFNWVEFDPIKKRAGKNNFKLSVKTWIEKTNAKGIYAMAGRYGGTFAHKDIAFEFGSWLSPEFKLYLIKEFQRLKQIELRQNLADNRIGTKIAELEKLLLLYIEKNDSRVNEIIEVLNNLLAMPDETKKIGFKTD